MRPAIGHRPKALVKIGGRPLLAHALDAAVSLGASRICVVARDNVLEDTFGAVWQGIPVSYCIQSAAYGLGAAVRAATGQITDPFGVIFGDLYVPAPINFTPAAYLDAGTHGVVAVAQVPWAHAHRYAVVSMDSSGFISRIEEKPEQPETRWVEVGIYLFPAPLLDAPMPQASNGEDQLQSMENWLLENGYRLRAAKVTFDWINVNTPEDLEQARALAASDSRDS